MTIADPPRRELFAFWRSSATYRVRVALNLKGVEVPERFVDLDAGGQRDDAFLAVNPLGAVPALRERADGNGGAVLTQSLAILEYLDETVPEPPLLPADPHSRARVRSIALMLAADTHPLIVPRVKRYLTTEGRFADADWRAWQVHWFTTGLHGVERRLLAEAATGSFCHGDRITTADICLASILVVMRVFGIAVAGIPTVERIMAACEAHEAFRLADPGRQEGAPGG